MCMCTVFDVRVHARGAVLPELCYNVYNIYVLGMETAYSFFDSAFLSPCTWQDISRFISIYLYITLYYSFSHSHTQSHILI